MSNMRTLDIKSIRFGEGMPKICVPIIGKTKEEILNNTKTAISGNPDLIEWRVDSWDEIFTEENEGITTLKPEWTNVLKTTFEDMKAILGEKILLFTFRSKSEGGEKELYLGMYNKLNKVAVDSDIVDLIDIEGIRLGEKSAELIEYAHKRGVKVVGSKHYFDKTPEQQEMVETLMQLQYMGVDMPKLAVMPQTHGDVARLMDATMEMNARFADRPIITMSMAEEGRVSRFMGEAFGSAVTFGIATVASAPGQINAEGLRKLLELVHSEI